jgi:hypothetical protein
MSLHDLPRVKPVLTPDGVAMSIHDLPSPQTHRWVTSRKALVVAGVRGGIVSIEYICNRYQITINEYVSWHWLIESYGFASLRTTRTQHYRDGEHRHPDPRFRKLQEARDAHERTLALCGWLEKVVASMNDALGSVESDIARVEQYRERHSSSQGANSLLKTLQDRKKNIAGSIEILSREALSSQKMLEEAAEHMAIELRSLQSILSKTIA